MRMNRKAIGVVAAAGAIIAIAGTGGAVARSLITGNDIAAHTITSQNLAGNSVDGGKITAGAVGWSELSSGVVTRIVQGGGLAGAAPASVAGPAGPQGPQGIPGPAGNDGQSITGPQGPAGAAGTNGYVGNILHNSSPFVTIPANSAGTEVPVTCASGPHGAATQNGAAIHYTAVGGGYNVHQYNATGVNVTLDRDLISLSDDSSFVNGSGWLIQVSNTSSTPFELSAWVVCMYAPDDNPTD